MQRIPRKVSISQVDEMRHLKEQGWTYAQLSEKYKVGVTTIFYHLTGCKHPKYESMKFNHVVEDTSEKIITAAVRTKKAKDLLESISIGDTINIKHRQVSKKRSFWPALHITRGRIISKNDSVIVMQDDRGYREGINLGELISRSIVLEVVA